MAQLNRYVVGAQGSTIVMLCPPPPRMTRVEACNLCAYLRAIAGFTDEELDYETASTNDDG